MNNNNSTKNALIGGAILLLLIFLLFGFIRSIINSHKPASSNNDSKPIYENAEVLDIMSGSGKYVIDTYTLVRADREQCTDEALTDWYFNFVLNNSDSKFHYIIYNDDPSKGIGTNQVGLIKDGDITYDNDNVPNCTISEKSTLYTVDTGAKTIKKSE